ncbi:transmembrane anterior posterior transformation protein 1 homolog [Octopus bimaculoides]|uniref:Transmembrane anterior posterior transformation protein 1 homolog n=1 Tax=Octopus bimaculoides TaxID=37653 RepID=A0A0L8I5D7_OCTBM|nr:transmembrane anterior posterior transformation protein 1 homolog [Octopus bimaculoides]|eukprot:XP_014790977.1 PREDICTED: transmembrane anterior posterior transformation protein 1 homolog [Octopus bimaculoides]
MAAYGTSQINNSENITPTESGYNSNLNRHQTTDLNGPNVGPSDVRDKVETVYSSVHHGAKMLPRSGFSLFSYFTSELTRGYVPEKDQKNFTEKRKRIYTFIKIPFELEQFVIYGFFQCVDAFLFIFTFLPLRICLALLKLLTHPCGFFMYGSRKILEPSQTCDILKGIIIVLSCFILNYLDISMMYHIIRGQAVLKLYVFYNIVELADKLFIGIGQDFLDSLFWSATEPRGRKREHIGVLGHLILAIFYVILHSILILVQATILNVAFNSHNKSLLIIMMSNNFVEIKINVFKRVDKKNLFQISCSDARERFQYIILLFIVFVRNMAEFSWNPEHISVILPDAVMILLAEVVVDWLKHAFISKFNEISKEVYADFSLILAQDMVSSRQTQAFTDHSDLLSRRMGFTPLPLACILYQVCVRSFKVHGYLGFAVLVMVYLCLTSTKVLNTMLLLGRANKLIYGNTSGPPPSSQSSTPPPSSSPNAECTQQPPPIISVPVAPVTPTKISSLLLSTSCPNKTEDSPCSSIPMTPSTPPPTPTTPTTSTAPTTVFAPATFTAALSAAAEASSRCGSFISSSRDWDEFPPAGAMPIASLDKAVNTLQDDDFENAASIMPMKSEPVSPPVVIRSQPSGITEELVEKPVVNMSNNEDNRYMADTIRKRKNTVDENVFFENQSQQASSAPTVEKISKSTSMDLDDICQEATLNKISEDKTQHLPKEGWL